MLTADTGTGLLVHATPFTYSEWTSLTESKIAAICAHAPAVKIKPEVHRANVMYGSLSCALPVNSIDVAEFIKSRNLNVEKAVDSL